MDIVNHYNIENRIFLLRGLQVMLDFHLAELYSVETKRLNEQVKRNIERFPNGFMFQLTNKEWDNLQSQIATAATEEEGNNLQSQIATAKRRTLPYVFSEQGVAMLSAVLRSKTAVKVSIQIMQAFVHIRHLVHSNALLYSRMDNMEMKQLETDQKIEQIFRAIENKKTEPNKGIFFEGEIFDAYLFISNIIKKAESSIILIDNFIDETVLTMLSKRSEKVNAIIYTKQISKQLRLDLTKHNQQYSKVKIKVMPNSHDRFLIIDNKELYHIGASLKDLGKKWFAFSRMDSLLNDVLAKLKQ